MAARQAALWSRLTELRRRPTGSQLSESEALRVRLERRRKLTDGVLQSVPYLRVALLFGGYAALLALPSELLSRRTYVSENAIQPGQVNTYWSWHDVAIADGYAKDVERWALLDHSERGREIADVFSSLGIPSSTQFYAYSSPILPPLNGTNAYCILPATRADGAEALVLMASWRSRVGSGDELIMAHEGKEYAARDGVNVRGVASVLALATYLRKFSLFSKDIIFLIADGYSEGTQAWLQAYHGLTQQDADFAPLKLTTGGIWAALALDYPFHSFDHFQLYFEGVDGLLPNLDMINTVTHVARWTGGVPVRLHSHSEDLGSVPLPPSLPAFAGKLASHKPVLSYYRSTRNLLSQTFYGSFCTGSGPESLFSRFRISSLALYSPPAPGPHGFYAVGKTVESSMRSLNNLLERFHQSFWLYLLKGSGEFISVANYLFGPLALSIAVTLTGLEVWAKTFEQNGEKATVAGRGGAVATTLQVMGLLHGVGLAMLAMLGTLGAVPGALVPVAVTTVATPLLLSAQVSRTQQSGPERRQIALVMRSLVLLLAGAILAVVSVLSFPVGASLSVAYAVPLAFIRPTSSRLRRWSQFVLAVLLSPAVVPAILSAAGWWGSDGALAGLMSDWKVLRTWFMPFTLGVTVPLLMQLATVSLLNPCNVDST